MANHRLHATEVTLGYGDRAVVAELSVEIPPGQITGIVGANACGKSTLLRGLARLLAPVSGAIYLDGHRIGEIPTRYVATKLGLLPQAPVAPAGIRVAELVGRGRYPYQGWLRGWTARDDEAVARALTATGTLELADRAVDELSGGQRQRVWVAMALAQETELLLLDEPTTFLDLAHQVEVLDLLTDLNRQRGTTIALVLHDLNLAGRYADHLIAMKQGRIAAQGTPGQVLTGPTVTEVFGLAARVVPDPVSGTPLVVPVGRHHLAGGDRTLVAAGAVATGGGAPPGDQAGHQVHGEETE